MTQRKISLLLAGVGLILFMLALSGCGQSEPALPSPTTLPPTTVASPTSETAAEPEADIQDEDAGVGEETDHCLACHTDQAKLMEVADPVIETESENEGEG
jgi:hypothetical protein